MSWFNRVFVRKRGVLVSGVCIDRLLLGVFVLSPFFLHFGFRPCLVSVVVARRFLLARTAAAHPALLLLLAVAFFGLAVYVSRKWNSSVSFVFFKSKYVPYTTCYGSSHVIYLHVRTTFFVFQLGGVCSAMYRLAGISPRTLAL